MQWLRGFNTVNLDYLQNKGSFCISHMIVQVHPQNNVWKKSSFFLEARMDILLVHASIQVTLRWLQCYKNESKLHAQTVCIFAQAYMHYKIECCDGLTLAVSRPICGEGGATRSCRPPQCGLRWGNNQGPYLNINFNGRFL